MENENENQIVSFVKVWCTAYVSLIYCYVVGKFVGKGFPRLLCVIPVISLFVVLPLKITSVNLCGPTSFFLAWLANFKLILFSFGLGPLAAPLSLLHFVSIASFPIKIQCQQSNNKKKPAMGNLYAFKVALAAVLVLICEYNKVMSERAMQILYSLYMCLCLDIILAVAAALASVALGAELEPQFDRPLMSTSLQNFWGRRWNLMVTGILRPTVYEPFREAAARLIGRERATYPAVVVTFAVSALMHELILYHMGRLKPTWEVTWFFILHGICVARDGNG